MNRRGTGLGFCAIAAFLYASKYVSAAIFGSGVNTWDSRLFSSMLQYIGSGLIVASVVSLVTGIVYLVLAETGK